MSQQSMQADPRLVLIGESFVTPELAAARASTTPQQMYVDLAAKCPVRKLGEQAYSLLTMGDILYVNTHHDVEQAGKYLGSTRYPQLLHWRRLA